jgi:hypothetical protein
MSAIDTAAINVVRPKPRYGKRPARKAPLAPAKIAQAAEPLDVPAEV